MSRKNPFVCRQKNRDPVFLKDRFQLVRRIDRSETARTAQGPFLPVEPPERNPPFFFQKFPFGGLGNTDLSILEKHGVQNEETARQ